MRPIWLVLGILTSTLFGGGCATTTTDTASLTPLDDIRPPSTLLEGASLEAARSVAMAAAHSKGWRVLPDNNTQLRLEREISPNSPQAQALGQRPEAPPPRIQIRTNFAEHHGSTQVGLRAFVRVNPDTEDEKRIEYTDEYQTELAISLSSLQSAWLTAAHQLASPAPIPQQATAPQLADLVETPGETLAETPAEPIAEPIAEPWREQETAETPPPALAGPETIAPTRRNEMLVLDTQSRTGTWAYYAERHAQQQGCALTEHGAVLLQKTPGFELHEVGCTNSANRLIKCQGGFCQSMH